MGNWVKLIACTHFQYDRELMHVPVLKGKRPFTKAILTSFKLNQYREPVKTQRRLPLDGQLGEANSMHAFSVR